jgi:Mce-associated membrane protein
VKLLKSRRLDDLADNEPDDESVDEPAPTLGCQVDAVDECTVDETGSAADDSRVDSTPPALRRRRVRWSTLLVYAVMPAVMLLLAVAAAFLKWQDGSTRDAQTAAQESARAATDGTIALLSYKPDTVQHDLEAAKSKLTGNFLDAYTKLTHDVVIPGAQQKQISAVAAVPAAASTSATADHAVVLLFVNQTTTIGTSGPSNTASTVRVTLDKIDNRWLIAQFDPI